jgi:cephalosporin-C deacetylase
MEKDGRTYRGLATAGYRPTKSNRRPTTRLISINFGTMAKPSLANFRLMRNSNRCRLRTQPLMFSRRFSKRRRRHEPFKPHLRHSGNSEINEPESKISRRFERSRRGRATLQRQTRLPKKELSLCKSAFTEFRSTLDQTVYDNLAAGALNRYMVSGLENKNSYYYRRVILGCMRANDFLLLCRSSTAKI